MPSSHSPSLRLDLQEPGENINAWGLILNNGVFMLLDYAVAGWLAKTITGDSSLTTALGSTDEARAAMVKFNGALTVNATITIPSVSKSYYLWNNTNKALTITTGAGATVSLDSGDKTVVYCDGAGVHTISFGGYDLKTYIGTVVSGSGNVPGAAGNAGKFLYSDGSSFYWKEVQTTDLGDYEDAVLGVQVALAVAL